MMPETPTILTTSPSLFSQFLKDRHPYIAPPFQKEVDPQEVAIAYGRRQVDKLVGVLKLGEELPPEQSQQALQALLDCVSSQVG